jgi:Ras-related C3 botulinum toxin substrate 1
MKAIKIVVVGDDSLNDRGHSIKTEMLVAYIENKPPEYVPTVFDNYSANTNVERELLNIGLWDTSRQDDYDRLRPLSYPQTDCFIFIFSVISKASYENIMAKWHPEVQHYCSYAPFIVAGGRIDLRDDSEVIQTLKEHGRSPITPEEGIRLAQTIGAIAYCEFSAKTFTGIKETIETAALVGINNQWSYFTHHQRRRDLA